MPTRRTAGLATLLVMALSACGTTVPLTQQGTLGGAPGQSLPGGDLDAGASDPLALGTASGTGSPTSAASAAGSPGSASAGSSTPALPGSGGTGRTGSSSAAPSAVSGPGVTPTTVSFGFLYQRGAADQQAALGNTSTPSNSPVELMNALAADVNERGGLQGRRLKIEFYDYEVTPTSTVDGLSQEFCNHFTRDVKVLAVAQFSTPALIECLRKAGVLATSGGLAATESEYQRYSNYYDTGTGTLDQVQRNLVEALLQQGWFSNWDTRTGTAGGAVKPELGVLAPEDPAQPGYKESVEKTLLPELARRGYPVAPENVVYWNASNNTDAVAGISSAELRFANNGVTHVIPVELNSLVFFAQAADKQRYRPRYAITSYHSAPLAVSSGLLPAQQLQGAMGVGWLPSDDLSPEDAAAATYTAPDKARCLRVVKRAGLDTSSPTNALQALRLCDLVTVFSRAAATVPSGVGLNVASMTRAVEALGTSVPFASLTVGRYAAGKRSPLERGWQMAWDPETRYLRYASRPTTLR